MLLAEYLQVKESLTEIYTSAMPSSLKHMMAVMLSQLAVYQDEALASDVVIFATVLNPKYRVRFFELHYPDYADQAKQLIEEVFNASLENWPVTPACTPSPTATAEPDKAFNQFDLFTSSASLQTPKSKRASELKSYLQGSNLIVPGQTELSWWNVSVLFNHLYLIHQETHDTLIFSSYVRKINPLSRFLLRWHAITSQSRLPHALRNKPSPRRLT